MKKPLFRPLATALALSLVAGLGTIASAETVITESAGTVSEFSPDTLVIRSETDPAPRRYVISKEVSYVDDNGVPVAAEVVRSGLPVTVHYERDGDRVIARRVIVHRRAAVTTGAVEVQRVPAPVVVERPTIVERPAVVERPVVVERPPVVEERRTVVRTPAVPVPLVEERTTTTTTTTTKK